MASMSSRIFDMRDDLIAEYIGLDSLGEALVLRSPTLRTLEEYGVWLSDAIDLQFNQAYCEMRLGKLIGSSVRQTQFNWNKLVDLFEINKWVESELEYLIGDDEEVAGEYISDAEDPVVPLVTVDN
ncbi:hypothetical protein JAAARDRAFT_193342 [Jaapia argillacea MUCL 33604]|uniref:Uncharacterized protein n=1 Tax=Jaapia argillacea MUCL 33604 TaxID=933084 RepID=A0A067Q8B1_9AGAM|nr:hypothetical protein JAAARDRAFT_193342 [Jaapia argillacea MUCL 33604]